MWVKGEHVRDCDNVREGGNVMWVGYVRGGDKVGEMRECEGL